MSEEPEKEPAETTDDFEREAASGPQNMFAEFLHFLLTNKKWWLTPIILVLIAVSALVMLAASPLAPAIYTLF